MQPVDLIFAMLVNLLFAAIAKVLRFADTLTIVVAWTLGVAMLSCAGAAAYVLFVLFAVEAQLVQRLARSAHRPTVLDGAGAPGLRPLYLLAHCLPAVAFASIIPLKLLASDIMVVAAVSGLACACARVAGGCVPLPMNARLVDASLMPGAPLEEDGPVGSARICPGTGAVFWAERTLRVLPALCAASLVVWALRGVVFADVWIVMLAGGIGEVAGCLLRGRFCRRLKHDQAIGALCATSAACAVGFILAGAAR